MPQTKLAALRLTEAEERVIATLIVYLHHEATWVFTNEDEEQELSYPAYLSLVNKLNETQGIKGTFGYKRAEEKNKAREDANKG